MNKVTQLWLAALTLVIIGCAGLGSKEPMITQKPGSLQAVCGHKWELQRLRVNGDAIEIAQSRDFTFLCNREGQVMGKSGINTYRGAMQVTDSGQLLWDTGSFASTKMAGPEPLMNQENAYLRALAGSRQAFLKAGGARLILRDESGEIYLEFTKAD